MEKYINKDSISALVVVILCFIVYYVLKSMLNKYFKVKRIDSRREKTIVSVFTNIIRYTFIAISLSFVLNAFGVDTRAIVASLGVVGLVVGLSLQDIIKDFVAGMFIIMENQYAVGDLVTIGGFRGEVISFGLKTTKLKAYNGEIKIISNRMAEQTINHSLKNPILFIDFAIPADHDVVLVREILEKSCEKLTKELEHIIGDVVLLGVNNMTHLATEFLIMVETEKGKNFEIRRQILFEVKRAILENREKLIIKK